MITQRARRQATDGQADAVSAERFGGSRDGGFLCEARNLCYLQDKGGGATMPCASNSYEWLPAMKESPVLADEPRCRIVMPPHRQCINRAGGIMKKFPFLPGFCACLRPVGVLK